MNPTLMAIILAGLLGMFAYSANRRWQLLKVGLDAVRNDAVGARLGRVFTYALQQKKMRNYPAAGAAHMLIFMGFGVLLLRTLLLWGRGFDADFNLFVLGDDGIVGQAYDFLKDVFATGVLAGVSVFVYYRVVKPQRRMTLHLEGLVILCIIATMMLADMTYDGAAEVLHVQKAQGAIAGGYGPVVDTITAHFRAPAEAEVAFHAWPSPAGSLFAVLFAGLPTGALVALAQAGFWIHGTLVLVFLNILPYSKHFHIITALPNVFTSDLAKPGRMRPMAASSDQLAEIVGAAAEKDDPLTDPVGVARIEHFTWKAILDFYTCTECGRCSDNCPAHRTSKLLSPKHLTLDLRNHLYGREAEFLGRPGGPKGLEAGAHADAPSAEGNPRPEPAIASHPVDLVPGVIHPDVIWACTTCRACEEQCPVMISYVDKITDMRRNLVLIKGEFPAELQKPFQGMETNGNPWNLSRMDRAAWSDGLGVRTMAEHPDAEVLFWIGCAASYDDRAKRVARATAKLLQAAKVDFAILGEEETCTGDAARRAGNEFLYMMLAEQNIATINGYKEKGGAKKVLTACPHCFNTLLNEYPDLGGHYDVVHHTDYLLGLLAEKRLTPTRRVEGKVAYHDSCYLGRYNEVYESPRDILARIPGVQVVEAEMNRNKGLCCGAGGAQMFMEEQNKDRMNVRRTLQLVDTGAKTIATGCPFCMTMLTDGLKAQSLEDQIRQLDVAELLAESCALDDAPVAAAS